MLGDVTVGQAYQLTQWLELVSVVPIIVPHRPHTVDTMLSSLIVLFLLQCGLNVILFIME